jgi:uncharacterized protein affecting Mg2+/Co2+ transport
MFSYQIKIIDDENYQEIFWKCKLMRRTWIITKSENEVDEVKD